MTTKHHKILKTLIALVFLSLSITFIPLQTIEASALDYSSNANVEFTFNPTITVNLSGDLIIDNLAPGSYADSNIVTVTTSTNVPYGFTLMATAGTNSTSNSLVNSTNNNYTFTALDANKSTLASFSDNTWGYSYSTDNGTTWVSGNTGSTTTGYNGLPKDTNTTAAERGNGGITLATTDTNTTSKIQFKIGAKASSTQPAGTYTNTINFYAVGNTVPEPASLCPDNALCMQTMAFSDCPAAGGVAYDARDDSDYTVRSFDGVCWMTQNLRTTGTISSELSNFTGADFNTQAIAENNDYTKAYAGYYDDTTNGAYYNFCAVSAGTICDMVEQDATQDICPKNWRLPVKSEIDAIASSGNGANWGMVDSSYEYYDGDLGDRDIVFLASNNAWWSATAVGVGEYDYIGHNCDDIIIKEGFDISCSFDDWRSSVAIYYALPARCVRSS